MTDALRTLAIRRLRVVREGLKLATDPNDYDHLREVGISTCWTIESQTPDTDLSTTLPETELDCHTLGDHLALTRKALGLNA